MSDIAHKCSNIVSDGLGLGPNRFYVGPNRLGPGPKGIYIVSGGLGLGPNSFYIGPNGLCRSTNGVLHRPRWLVQGYERSFTSCRVACAGGGEGKVEGFNDFGVVIFWRFPPSVGPSSQLWALVWVSGLGRARVPRRVAWRRVKGCASRDRYWLLVIGLRRRQWLLALGGR